MRTGNLFSDLPAALSEEQIEVLATGASARIERIVSTGQSSREGFWYDQDQDEWVVVLRGRAVVEIEGAEAIEMGPGDWLLLSAHHRHRVSWTSTDEPTVWLAVHLPG